MDGIQSANITLHDEPANPRHPAITVLAKQIVRATTVYEHR